MEAEAQAEPEPEPAQTPGSAAAPPLQPRPQSRAQPVPHASAGPALSLLSSLGPGPAPAAQASAKAANSNNSNPASKQGGPLAGLSPSSAFAARRGSHCSLTVVEESAVLPSPQSSAQAVRRKSLVLRMDKEVADSDEALQCDR